MEAVWPRFLPAYMRLHEEIERGAIGKVWQITASFGWKETRDRWGGNMSTSLDSKVLLLPD